jgi:hypothetical protein
MLGASWRARKPLGSGHSSEAPDGTRTHDLLHGKKNLIRRPTPLFACKPSLFRLPTGPSRIPLDSGRFRGVLRTISEWGSDGWAPATPAGSRLADGQDDLHPHGRPVLHAPSLQLARRPVHLEDAAAPQRQLPLLARDEQEREGDGRVGGPSSGARSELSVYLVLVVPFPLRVSGIAKSGGGVLGIGFGRGGFSGIGTYQSTRSARRSIALPRHPARPRRPRTSG